jgi:hypothetical protein
LWRSACWPWKRDSGKRIPLVTGVRALSGGIYPILPKTRWLIIYYRYFLLESSERAEYCEKSIAEVGRIIEVRKKYGAIEFEAIIETNLSSYKSMAVAEFAAINGVVDWLFEENWEQERRKERGGPGFLSEVIGDIFKYRIKNVWSKTGIRRAIERKMTEKRIDEIPNLIDFMNSYWESDGYSSFLLEHLQEGE